MDGRILIIEVPQNLVMDARLDQAFGLLFRQSPGRHRHLPPLRSST